MLINTNLLFSAQSGQTCLSKERESVTKAKAYLEEVVRRCPPNNTGEPKISIHPTDHERLRLYRIAAQEAGYHLLDLGKGTFFNFYGIRPLQGTATENEPAVTL